LALYVVGVRTSAALLVRQRLLALIGGVLTGESRRKGCRVAEGLRAVTRCALLSVELGSIVSHHYWYPQ
jgi:hypothetical protein